MSRDTITSNLESFPRGIISNVTIPEVPVQDSPPTVDAPWLCRIPQTGVVVLFTGISTGTVVCSSPSSNQWPSGHFSQNWVSADDPLWFRLPAGSKVTLEVTPEVI